MTRGTGISVSLCQHALNTALTKSMASLLHWLGTGCAGGHSHLLGASSCNVRRVASSLRMLTWSLTAMLDVQWEEYLEEYNSKHGLYFRLHQEILDTKVKVEGLQQVRPQSCLHALWVGSLTCACHMVALLCEQQATLLPLQRAELCCGPALGRSLC